MNARIQMTEDKEEDDHFRKPTGGRGVRRTSSRRRCSISGDDFSSLENEAEYEEHGNTSVSPLLHEHHHFGARLWRSYSLPDMSSSPSSSYNIQENENVKYHRQLQRLHSLSSDDFLSRCCLADSTSDTNVLESLPVCRICMLELVEGNGILKLECNCKGDLAMLHTDCAVQWFTIKGNNVCDICTSKINNILVLLYPQSASCCSPTETNNVIENTSSSWHNMFSRFLSALKTKLEELSEFP